MEEVKRIYFLLLQSTGLKIKVIAKELDLDKYYVADIMFSPDNNKYWYINDSSLWFAKEGAIKIEEPKVDKLTTPLETPKVINVARYLQGHPSASLRAYINNLANFRTYTDDEIKELFSRYRKGDREAYDLIVKSNLKLVVGYAYLLRKDGAQIEDLIQEGNIGLLRAIELFDHSRSTSFINYAKNWVYQTIASSIINLSYTIRLPLNQYALYYKVQKFKEKYVQQNGFPPSVDAIMIDDDVDFERIAFLDKLPDDLKNVTVLSGDLDTFESHFNQIDYFEDAEYNRSYVYRLLKNLSGREEVIVRLFFGIGTEPETLSYIGERFNLTRERARQILVKAIRHMRNLKRNNEIYDEINITSVPGHEVETLDVAKFGDYVEIPNYKQLGIVINTFRSKKDNFLYVLRIADRKIFKMTKDGTLLSDKIKKSQVKTENLTPERKAFLKSLYHSDDKEESATKTQNTQNNQTPQAVKETKRRIPEKAVPSSNTLPDMAKIGDRVLYDKRRGTVVEKRSAGGFSRLILKYDNGTFDNVPNDTDRYRII